MEEIVHLDIDPERGTATIQLDRPPHNAASRQLWSDIEKIARTLEVRADVRAVVVWGGPEIFSAGGDIKDFAAYGYTEVAALAALQQRSIEALARLPQITVAAVNGFALGGGCEIALACDFRIAGQDATFGLPEIRLGIMPGAGGTQRLPRLVGVERAKDLILSGRTVEASEAAAIGLVSRVVASTEVYSEAAALAAEYATGPYSMRLAKRAIDEGLRTTLDQGLRLETTLMSECFATQDAQIGIRSFLGEGPRPPRFKGR